MASKSGAGHVRKKTQSLARSKVSRRAIAPPKSAAPPKPVEKPPSRSSRLTPPKGAPRPTKAQPEQTTSGRPKRDRRTPVPLTPRQKTDRRSPLPVALRQRVERPTPTEPRKPWLLRLYVAGDSPRSRLALSNLRRLCEERLKGQYEIEVIDLAKLPHLAKADQILAVPTLVRSIPSPMKRIIGDLSNADRALIALDLDETRGSS